MNTCMYYTPIIIIITINYYQYHYNYYHHHRYYMLLGKPLASFGICFPGTAGIPVMKSDVMNVRITTDR